MKKLYLIARNHMDPSWLRCFTHSFRHPETGETVRPYADIEETQILEYMDFAELYGVKYQIEQSAVVKKFLERNPDQLERFRDLVKRGLLELAGGGETVIDRNLTSGESWARNHLYSSNYYKRVFGHQPKYAITPDIFGLPSQLPQFFRSVGYDALIIFDRVLKNNKPFWRGLDGTLIVLDSCFLQPPEPNLRTADCVKLPACGACGGEGCAFCEGTGVDMTYDMTRPDKALLKAAYYGNMSADVFLETLLQTDKEEYFVMITTEEPRIGSFLYGPLREAAARHGIEVQYLGFEENHEVWCPGQEDALRAGNIPEELIDTRAEGNPAACGCYSSRIEIKKANSELEQLLTEAESLAAAVRFSGGWRNDTLPRRAYPAKKLEALWNKMAFIQFHDCITGTHVDAAYTELMDCIREVRRGVHQIYADAAREWCKLHDITVPDDYFAAVCFNPTQEPQTSPVLTLCAPEGTNTVELYHADLTPADAFDFRHNDALVGVTLKLRTNALIPPFGWRVFLWKPAATEEKPALTDITQACFSIENRFFSILTENGQIRGIYDKTNHKTVTREGGAYLALGADFGSPYGRTEPERNHRCIRTQKAAAVQNAHFSRLILSGTLHEPENGIESLAWTQEITLYKDEPLVRFRTQLDWNGKDTRVFASFPPAEPNDGLLYGEVPFGMMARGTPGETNLMGITDEWPTLGYAGVTNGDFSTAVLKGGLPGTRLLNGKLEISLLRAASSEDARYAGMNDTGHHVCEYALTAWAGDFAAGNAAARAASFLLKGHTLPLAAPGIWQAPINSKNINKLPSSGELLPFLRQVPPELRLSCVKWAEDGEGLVIRCFESAGKSPTLSLADGVKMIRCDTLETVMDKTPLAFYKFRPFEIATFRIKTE